MIRTLHIVFSLVFDGEPSGTLPEGFSVSMNINSVRFSQKCRICNQVRGVKFHNIGILIECNYSF